MTHDGAHRGRPGLAARPVLWLIRGYQLLISPVLGPRCRYLPTCSEYACEAVAVHGAARGCLLATRRLLRCHPFGGSGFDPVPPPAGHVLGTASEAARRPAPE